MFSFLRLLICIVVGGFCLYFYIDQRNDLTELRLKIPDLARKVNIAQEENNRLRYEIDTFESPLHLMELARKPEFSHLKHPYLKDILQIHSVDALQVDGPHE